MMVNRFQLASGALVPSDAAGAPVQLYVNPDAAERELLRATYGLDEHAVASALDPDEVSRLEVVGDGLFLIWKRPRNYSGGETFFFDVGSLGMLVTGERLVIIAGEELSFGPAPRAGQALRTSFDALLWVLSGTIQHYLGHVKVIKLIARDLQTKIQASMENQHLIRMFNLSESLVYYINAIASNGVVLTRLRQHAERLGQGTAVTGLIDDIVIDNEQSLKQAEIYSTVFSGLMDARGNLINNNMNVLLKNLTIINVVFLPLNLLASIGGMSEYSMMTQGIDWRISYALFGAGMVVIGWFTAKLLKRRGLTGAMVPGGRRAESRTRSGG